MKSAATQRELTVGNPFQDSGVVGVGLLERRRGRTFEVSPLLMHVRSERKGNNLKGFRDVYLKAKARSWL